MAPVAISPLYSTSATAHGGRNGRVKSEDGVLDLPLAMPKELGGAGGAVTNPEQLFAAGYSACFESALRLVARMQGKNLGNDAGVRATVTIGKTPDGGFGLAVELQGILPGIPNDEAQKLMAAAHEVCPYSKATRGNIDVKVSVAG
ncbi:organic hydroperoxide resistance protein [Myxococcus xanthus DK 1622]|uniref:Organic hydroperoxide resistance protein n=1 Tax=Myxococcus xanthus (strain DK1622) TaxID=246197 RepID=Q1DEK0_MYXXD|nr:MULTISPECIES: organic hydroperoxide resistance protein [Myxococcus]ABF89134.1 organic hydroperoxide resistance protein [Myxococcus xanthus DK 1622]NOJ55448.1 organic hydroperoxide resistance protein [Myxococcus xanthus]QPM80341.1 organic hydroperoxide resistance protein [Myxococcus xanthus]QQR45162.1 organic hydroperoxide resistance protein [Myxococcus xanthus]QVW69404.1 organic hydroperoxide resistance protein [Myxococcus xanthus DZ2]